MRASNAGATLNEPARFTEAVLFEPTAWKSCEGYVYGDRHSASPATAAPPPSLPLPLSHRSRRHPAEPTRLAGSPSRMERQRRSGLWLGAWECRRQHAQRSMLGAAPSVPTTFVDEGGRWPIATFVTKCSVTGRNHKPAYSWGRPAYSWRTASAPGRPGPPAARGMAAIGALIACAAAATGLAPSLHLASLGMPRAATSGVPPAASRLPGGSSSLEET